MQEIGRIREQWAVLILAGYRASRGGMSGRSVAAQYDPALRSPTPPLFLSVQLSLFGRISNGRVSLNPAKSADLEVLIR